MNKVVTFILLIFLNACTNSNSEQETVKISGKVNYSNRGYIFLDRLTSEGYEKIDSSMLDEGNEFHLAIPEKTEDIYRISFFGKQKVNFVASDKDILIQADGNNPNGNFQVTGSNEIEVVAKASQLLVNRNIQSDLIKQKLKNAMSEKDSLSYLHWSDSLNNIQLIFESRLKSLISNEEGSLTGLLLLDEYFDIEPHMDFYNDQMPGFERALPDHWFFKQVNEGYQSIKKLAIGAVAPDFTLPDPDGNLISLSSFRGSIVFIDFWGSWCQPCRLENPELVKVYDKYGGEQFEILGVSLERRKENWLKAIKKDGLNWVHVSDLKYFDSEVIPLYNITNVPMSFLLDSDGIIIAKNLHADELDMKLKELL